MSAQTNKNSSRLHITHAQNDARYVEMGRRLVLHGNPNADAELRAMNRGKNGRPFAYDNTTIMAVAIIRFACGLSYRACQGLAAGVLGEGNAPDHVTLYRRINSIRVDVSDGIMRARDRTGTIRLVPDGTGLAPATRGEWIHHKHETRRGFIRFSVMIEQETREILAVRVSDERTGDSPQFEGLLADALENVGVNPYERRRLAQAARTTGEPVDGRVEVRADGGYDTHRIFQLCQDLAVEALIKVHVNSSTRGRGVGKARSVAVLDQLAGGHPKKFHSMTDDVRRAHQQEWKRVNGYGRRWLVEIVFSSFKRMFGESVRAIRMANILQEISLKVHIYNRMLGAAREAVLRA